MGQFLKSILILFFILLNIHSSFSITGICLKDTLFNEQRKPFKFNSSLEISCGYSTRRYVNWNFRTINGVTFKENKFVGIGVGALSFRDQYFNLFQNFTYIPVFLRFSIQPVKTLPINVFSDIGTSFKGPDTDPFRITKYEPKIFKPIFLKLGLSNEFKIKKTNFYTSLSYQYNKARYFNHFTRVEYNIDKYIISDWYRSHTFEFSIGIRLK